MQLQKKMQAQVQRAVVLNPWHVQRALSRKPRSGEKRKKKINGNHNIFVLIFFQNFKLF